MIGVVAETTDHEVVREFFELFKTPWEFFREGQSYDILLCAGDCRPDLTARLVVVYAGQKTDSEQRSSGLTYHEHQAPRFLTYCKGNRLPVYGRTLTFVGPGGILLTDESTQECAGYIEESGDCTRARIGYDVFQEIQTLLTVGQPVANANIPTLELHIDFLRNLITGCGICLVEIPPVPDGYQFIACLTHDVDHPAIRLHKWDHTAFGFVYRATLGSVRKFIGGRISLRNLFKNWLAVLKLPCVYVGLAKDFWLEFADRYRQLEDKLPSTFFFIPYKNHPGVHGAAPSFRASGYGARDIVEIIHRLKADGQEVGLHGIDAWADSSKGGEEINEIRCVAGVWETGVRMHWLYFDKDTPAKLEGAGAAYDSSFGYNDAVGYRAGTTQVYKPLEVSQLLELPLHVMDTALFYPSRMELSAVQAAPLLEKMQDNAVRFGGALTVNWHDRSLAPERFWDEPYHNLLASLKSRGPWFATAGQAVAWFRKRRSAVFERDATNQGSVRINLRVKDDGTLPGLRLRSHRPLAKRMPTGNSASDISDASVKEGLLARMPSDTR